MSFHTIADVKNRSRLFRWLQERTAIRMESGADVWPFEELATWRGDVVVRASAKGIAVVIPLAILGPSLVPVGRQVGIREFCELIREKFPIIEQTKQEQTAPPRNTQEEIPWMARRTRP